MNPFAKYLPIVELLAGLFMVAGITYGVHQFLEHEREIGRDEIRAADAAQLAAAKDAAHVLEVKLQQVTDEATKHASEREQTIRVLAAAAGVSSNGLLDTLARIRDGVPGATIEALGKSVATLTAVLGECQGRYITVATAADRHASDTKTLNDAWPTKTPSSTDLKAVSAPTMQ